MSKTVRVADFVAEFLEQKGVKHVFMLSGGGMMHLQDALSRSKNITYVCQHHEQACTFAADAYARLHGLGVCYATSGPGAANTVTGLVSAYQDSVPIFVIAGQAKTSETIRATGNFGLRQLGTFEVDMIPIVTSITKYAACVSNASTARFHLEKAYHLALEGRPGPVYLEFPVDVQGALIDPNVLPSFVRSVEKNSEEAVKEQLDNIFEKLLSAKRPLIFAGHGIRCANQTKELKKFIEAQKIPVVTTSLALDTLEYDHPLYVGHPGVKGDRAGNLAVQTADVILFLGSSLRAQVTGYELKLFAPQAYKIHIDPERHVLESTKLGIKEKVVCKLQDFFDLANGRSPSHNEKSAHWRQRCLQWKTDFPVAKEPHVRNSSGINYYDVIETLSEVCTSNEVLIADAGSAYYILGQAFRNKPEQRALFCGALGQMGFTLPAVTGASFAAPGKTVIGITGDGSLQTNIHELSVIAKHNRNTKILVVNNDGYSCIRNTQKNYFNSHFSGTDDKTGVAFPKLKKLCEACELPYIAVSQRAELKDTLAKLVKTTGSVLCEVFVNPTQEFLPSVQSQRQPDGKMVSKPLHDMYPFMEPDKLTKLMKFE